MSTIDATTLREEIEAHKQRLRHLRVTAAKYGLDTPPHIKIEIDEIEKKLEELGQKVQQADVGIDQSKTALFQITRDIDAVEKDLEKIVIVIEKRRLYRIVALLVGAVVIASLFFFIGRNYGIREGQETTTSLVAPTIDALVAQQSLPMEVHTYDVDASRWPFASTRITVEEGDGVQIIVQDEDANWYCSSDSGKPDKTSAEGIYGSKQGRDRHVPSANLCELVGYIQNEAGVSYFRVGSYEQFTARVAGTLYLGANDDRNDYRDNSGILPLKITVTRRK
jgi:hypothetical protein